MKLGASLKEPKPRMPRETYLVCLKATRGYLKANACITNRLIREVAGINYDQAIAFFNIAIAEKSLVRVGTSSTTRYVLPES